LSRDLERPLTFHTLYDSSNVSVSDYNCRACRGGPAAGEHTDSHMIVLAAPLIFPRFRGHRPFGIGLTPLP